MPTFTVLMYKGERIVTNDPTNKHFSNYEMLGCFKANNLEDALKLVSSGQVKLDKCK